MFISINTSTIYVVEAIVAVNHIWYISNHRGPIQALFTCSHYPPTHLIEICQWFILSDQHLGKLGPLFWVHAHHVPQQEDIVWLVADLLSIKDDLLELPSLSKALDNLYTNRYSATYLF